MSIATTEELESTAVIELADLTGHDRCDGCGSQAYVRVMLYTLQELTFCAHHYRKSESGLKDQTLRVRDETGRLAVKNKGVPETASP